MKQEEKAVPEGWRRLFQRVGVGCVPEAWRRLCSRGLAQDVPEGWRRLFQRIGIGSSRGLA